MGVPRSGTTALANALNTHPRVFCGIERFDWPLARAVYPFGLDDFLDERAPDANTHQRSLDILAQKTELDALGNKKPRYYVSLQALLQRASARAILIYRDPTHTAVSWNARALNHADKGWQRGMTGLYAFTELVQMLLAFGNLPDDAQALMVDYDALFIGPDAPQTLAALLDFIQAEPAPNVLEGFAKHQREMGEKLRAKNRRLYDFEQAFLDRYALNELGPRMAELRLARPAQLRPDIDAMLQRLAGTAFLDECITLLARYPESPAEAFLPNYLSGLFANADQSTVFDALAPSLCKPEHKALVANAREHAALTPAVGEVARAVLDHARRCAERNPELPLWHNIQGDQLMRMHRFGEACDAYNAALDLNPGDTLAQAGLARAQDHLHAARRAS